MPELHAVPLPTSGPDLDHRDVEPVRPSRDPFYDAPPDLATLAPGTVIRSRRVRMGLLGVIPQPRLRAWQLAYRSTDLDGHPEVAVTTVLRPRRRGGASPRGLIAYQCAIDAVSDRCFPSYAMRAGARAWGALPQMELTLVGHLLGLGYAVSICDHEGRSGAFAAPREPGYRVLDGLRAARSARTVGLPPDLPIGMFGYSGGGMATAWAAEMAPAYAPELRIAGAVLGSPVGDPGEAFLKLNSGPFAGLPALVVAGLRHVYPGLADVVRQHASMDGLRRLRELEEMTTVQAVLKHRGDDFDDYLDAPLADVLATEEVLAVFDDLRLGRHAPSCPVLVVQSVHDRVIDVRDVDDQVDRYLDAGARVLYVRDLLSEHISLMILGFPFMLDWLVDRLEGREDHIPPTGVRTPMPLVLYRGSWPTYARMGASMATALLGRVR